MIDSKQLQIENVEEEDIEQNLRVIRKPKRKKRYPGGKIFVGGIVSDNILKFVSDHYLTLSEFTEDDIENEWSQFIEGEVWEKRNTQNQQQ